MIFRHVVLVQGDTGFWCIFSSTISASAELGGATAPAEATSPVPPGDVRRVAAQVQRGDESPFRYLFRHSIFRRCFCRSFSHLASSIFRRATRASCAGCVAPTMRRTSDAPSTVFRSARCGEHSETFADWRCSQNCTVLRASYPA